MYGAREQRWRIRGQPVVLTQSFSECIVGPPGLVYTDAGELMT
jgi:hypothetical protein